MGNKPLKLGMILLTILIVMQTIAVQSQNQRPDVIIKYGKVDVSWNVLKGNNTESNLELMLTRTQATSNLTRVIGSPTIQAENNIISFMGDLTVRNTIRTNDRLSFIQKDLYYEDLPVNRRYIENNPRSSTVQSNIEVNRTLRSLNFNFMEPLENYTKVERPNGDITAFVNVQGSLQVVPYNDSNQEINLLGFRINVAMFLFQSSTREFLGTILITDFGFGNIIPQGIVDFLNNNGINNEVQERVRGRHHLRNQGTNTIDWIELGFNETLGLDMYGGFFEYRRNYYSFLITPDRPSSLSLSSISTDFESTTDDLTGSYGLNLESDLVIEEVEDELVEDALAADNLGIVDDVLVVSGTNTEELEDNTNLNNLNLPIFAAQTLGLLMFGYILLRYKRKT